MQETVTLDDVIKESFILREQESSTRKVFAAVLKAHGVTENVLHKVAEIGSTAAIKEAVKAGIGVSILSSRALQEVLPAEPWQRSGCRALISIVIFI